MADQLYYEDVEVGTEITPLVKHPTNTQLFTFSAVTRNVHRIHYDKDYAIKRGLPGVVVHGQLAGCFLGQLITDWAGDEGNLKKLTLSYKGMNFPGETLVCKGKVTRKYVEDDRHFVVCNIWVENPRGERTVTGTATVTLPAGD